MDVFRVELNAARDEGKALQLRPRILSGGGDGTASFALFILFKTLQAQDSRAEDGLGDTGNGFIWTDDEFRDFFPALAQLPLGSANDFGNILGWGQKYPGDTCCSCCTSVHRRARLLRRWMEHVIDPGMRVVNFDVWGMMPADGAEKVNFKLCELGGPRRKWDDGRLHLEMKLANKPVPFFVCLYLSCGFGGYLISRFQLNRRSTPLRNRAEYIKQGIGMVLERTPPEMLVRADGVKVDCDGQPYFPPRRVEKGTRGRGYREVGFYNINWQAHALHGRSRASCCKRICCSKREPIRFNDGFMDMYRMRFTSYLKNPGVIMQTDKRRSSSFTYDGGEGKGLFFQYDGEARFAFSPTGDSFSFHMQKVLNIPVVLGPSVNKSLLGTQYGEARGGFDSRETVCFEIHGDSDAERARVKRRILKCLSGEIEEELMATTEEICQAGLAEKIRDPTSTWTHA